MTQAWTVGCLAILFAGAMVTLPAQANEAFDRPLVFGINPIADHGVMGGHPDYEDRVWEMLRRIGARSVRLDASWRDVEPERGQRDWEYVDRHVRRALEIGAEPIMLIVNTPGWASPTGEPTHAYPPKEDAAADFENYCRDLAARTRGQVRYFEFWNEQNGWGWHTDRGFQRADEYIPWLRRAYYALKDGNPDCLVAVGGMDDAAGHAPEYLEKLYHYRDEWYPGEHFWDAVADHPYSWSVEAFQEKVDALLAVMDANGDTDMKLWLTEYGWSLRFETMERQAEEVARTLDYLVSPAARRVEMATYLCIADFENDWVGFGVSDSNLRPRPAFYAFRDHPAQEWPAQYAYEAQPVAPGQVTLHWRTRRPAVTRVVFPDNQGPETVVSDQPATEHTITLRELPREGLLSLQTLAVFEDGEEDVANQLTLVAPAPGVPNGDFTLGFDAGVARGWSIEGRAFCLDSAHTQLKLSRKGEHAQVLEARKHKQQALHSRMTAPALLEQSGEHVASAWTAAFVRGDPQHTAKRRLGVDPAGGDAPVEENIVWSDWTEAPYEWVESTVSFTSEQPRVWVVIEVTEDDPAGTSDYLTFVDEVHVSQP